MAIVSTGATNLNKRDTFSPASKFIELVEYDLKENHMDITFKSGSKYRYLDVYPLTFLSFKQSPTIDAFYSRAVKGNIQAVKLIDNSIGRKESAPLKQAKKEQTLDSGLRKQQARDERIAGTVARAFAG